MHYKSSDPDFQFWFSFIFKKYLEFFIKKQIFFINYIYYNY